MERTVTIVLTVINCVVAAVVLGFILVMSYPKSEEITTLTCVFSRNGTDVDVNCRGLALKSVPKSLPAIATKIDFRNNKLSEITNDSFGCFGQLRTLDFHKNFIRYIEEGSFKCMPKLSVLILTLGCINFSYESLPVGLFSNLKHLKKLAIDEQNILSSNWSYPEMTFMDLTNLESLSLNTPPVLGFGRSFSKMIHLKELRLDLDSDSKISHDTFAAFSGQHIHTLRIFNSGAPRKADNVSFKYFHQLQSLTLIDYHVCLRTTFEVLKVFSGKNMSVISLQHNFITQKQSCNKVLTPDNTKHLLSICVEKVELSNFAIRIIQRGTFDQEPFSKCVKYLNLDGNCMIVTKEVYLEIQGLLNLEYLSIILLEDMCVNCITVKSECNCTSNGCKLSDLSSYSDRNDYAWNNPTTQTRVSCGAETLHITLPKKLKKIVVPHLFQHITLEDCIIKIHGAENLEHIDISNWKLHTFNSKILDVRNLSSVNYMGNSWLYFDNFVFSESPNIETLNLAGNAYGGFLAYPPYFFMLFSVFRKLKYLSVRNNGFEYFPFIPEKLSNLSAIDLSNNKIKTLDAKVREGLDHLVNVGHAPSLDMQRNTFSCACNSLRFVAWVIETDVRFTNLEQYTCTNGEGNVVKMPISPASYLKHWRTCTSGFWLAFSVIICFLIITVFVICLLLDKYSLRLKCIFLKWFGLRFQVPKREDFLYDIFVYYSSKDDHTWVCNTFRQKMEEERGLRLCIPDRDFVPGSCTAEEILEAIHKSWKTVVYMTEVFLEDELCAFTLSSAVYASTNEMPNRLILLYSNEIFNKPLPPIVTQLLDGDDNFVLEELEELDQWDILYRKALCWV